MMSKQTSEGASILHVGQRPGFPVFDEPFRQRLTDLVCWRRDVRRFRAEPIPDDQIEALLALANMAPSVGLSQPWRFVLVESPARRAAVVHNFEHSNAEALDEYSGERAQLYATLKLAGLREAPVHLAVFTVSDTAKGHGLGSRTMPETLAYSTVGAIQTLWLAARARGIGMGWVSILAPDTLAQTLDVPDGWLFTAYLCLGYPEEEHLDPELARAGWDARTPLSSVLLRR